MLRGAVVFQAVDVGQCDVGNLRVLFCSRKGVDHVETRVETEGLEARQTRRGEREHERAKRGGLT